MRFQSQEIMKIGSEEVEKESIKDTGSRISNLFGSNLRQVIQNLQEKNKERNATGLEKHKGMVEFETDEMFFKEKSGEGEQGRKIQRSRGFSLIDKLKQT